MAAQWGTPTKEEDRSYKLPCLIGRTPHHTDRATQDFRRGREMSNEYRLYTPRQLWEERKCWCTRLATGSFHRRHFVIAEKTLTMLCCTFSVPVTAAMTLEDHDGIQPLLKLWITPAVFLLGHVHRSAGTVPVLFLALVCGLTAIRESEDIWQRKT